MNRERQEEGRGGIIIGPAEGELASYFEAMRKNFFLELLPGLAGQITP